MAEGQDIAAITWVLHEYCRGIDEHRVEEMVAAVYLPDAVDYRRIDRILRGHGQIRQMFLNAVAVIEATMHQLSNIQITVSGDTATSFSYVQANHWMVSTSDRGPIRPVDCTLAGTYTDEFVRTTAGWRIASRRVGYLGPSGLLVGTMPDSFHGFAGGPMA